MSVALLVPLALSGSSNAGMAPSVASEVQTVRIEVFSLFRPKVLLLSADNDWAGGRDGATDLVTVIDGQAHRIPHGTRVSIEAGTDGSIRVTVTASTTTSTQQCSGQLLQAYSGAPRAGNSSFWLEVPGKLRRRFTGTLELQTTEHHLEAIVTMPLETAVASVVQAESPPGAPMEALKAQAVAARSFLTARQAGHVGFDFCDTTHCQFLRSPPAANSPAAMATRGTAGMILTWHDERSAQDRTLAAMYARSCGGRTRTLRGIGIVSNGYPYYAVRCAYCSRHPQRWLRESATSLEAGKEAEPKTEKERLAFNRLHGWGALPSLSDPADAENHGQFTGTGIGHGLGLCQLGAADMARHGAGFAQILAHYYPNTKLTDGAH